MAHPGHDMDAGADPHERSGDSPGPTAAPTPARRGWLRVVWRTIVKSWNDGIFGMSAQAAFWMTLSLPPLLLGLLGSLGYVAGWFGPATVRDVQGELLQLSSTVFTDNVVDQIIGPTVEDILGQGRGAIVSVGFVLSLWAGSSALAALVDSITTAYQQQTVRNPIWQRVVSVLLYIVSLIGAVLVLPLLAIGPDVFPLFFPVSVRPTVSDLVRIFYYPGLGVALVIGLATLYKVALPRKFPWHRGLPGALLAMVVFLVSSAVMRFYIQWVTSTGYTYGALATPIAFLLFCFFIAMAIVLGAQFNNAIQEMWPSHMTHRQRRRWRRLEMDRRSARARVEANRAAWRRADPKRSGAEHTAPSPADTKQTLDLRRNGAAGSREAQTSEPDAAQPS